MTPRETTEAILNLPDGDDEACVQVTWDVGDPGLLGIEDVGVDDLKALARAYLETSDLVPLSLIFDPDERMRRLKDEHI